MILADMMTIVEVIQMMNGMEWNVKELPACNVVLNALSFRTQLDSSDARFSGLNED